MTGLECLTIKEKLKRNIQEMCKIVNINAEDLLVSHSKRS